MNVDGDSCDETGVTLQNAFYTQQSSRKCVPNPRSTSENGESNENTGMARRAARADRARGDAEAQSMQRTRLAKGDVVERKKVSKSALRSRLRDGICRWDADCAQCHQGAQHCSTLDCMQTQESCCIHQLSLKCPTCLMPKTGLSIQFKHDLIHELDPSDLPSGISCCSDDLGGCMLVIEVQ
jgi:hypothetical protein